MKPFFVALLVSALTAGCVSKALGSDDPGVEGRVFSMLTTCEVGTIEDIVMPAGSLVISVLNVSSVDAPSDGGLGFDLTKPMLQWAQSTDRYLNITCETDEVLIFYMEE